MSSRKAIAQIIRAAKRVPTVDWIGRPAYLAGLRRPGVHCSLPGELDHATGPAEATIDNPKGHNRSPPRPSESWVPAMWNAGRGCGRVATLLRCGSRPLGFLFNSRRGERHTLWVVDPRGC